MVNPKYLNFKIDKLNFTELYTLIRQCSQIQFKHSPLSLGEERSNKC